MAAIPERPLIKMSTGAIQRGVGDLSEVGREGEGVEREDRLCLRKTL